MQITIQPHQVPEPIKDRATEEYGLTDEQTASVFSGFRSEEQRSLLYEVADAILFEPPDHFDMHDWMNEKVSTDRFGNVCGSAMCIAGWAGVLDPSNTVKVTSAFGGEFVRVYDSDGFTFDDTRWAPKARESLGVEGQVRNPFGIATAEELLFFTMALGKEENRPGTVSFLRALAGPDPRPEITISEVKKILPKNSRRKGGSIGEYWSARHESTRRLSLAAAYWISDAQKAIDSGAQWYEAYALANAQERDRG